MDFLAEPFKSSGTYYVIQCIVQDIELRPLNSLPAGEMEPTQRTSDASMAPSHDQRAGDCPAENVREYRNSPVRCPSERSDVAHVSWSFQAGVMVASLVKLHS